MNKIKIAHVSSVHGAKDIRIFQKECITLSENYDVHLYNSHLSGKEKNIFFHKLPFVKNRLIRVLTSWIIAIPPLVLKNYKVIHFHDPELIFAAPVWKIFGKKVIYDVHENYSKHLEVKSYIPKRLKPIIFKIIKFIENNFSKFVDSIVVVHKDLNKDLNKLNKHTVVSNAPILDYQFVPQERKKQFCYLGAITEERGIYQIGKILNELNIKYVLAGSFKEESFKKKMLSLNNVEFVGWIDNDEKIDIISQSICGCCTFLPIEHHLISNPNKIYEYLNYGTPVLCSDFDSYKEVISEDQEFIFYTEILNKDKTEDTIKKIINLSNEEINQFGLKGNQFIKRNYNWDIEGKKLKNIYANILNLK